MPTDAILLKGTFNLLRLLFKVPLHLELRKRLKQILLEMMLLHVLPGIHDSWYLIGIECIHVRQSKINKRRACNREILEGFWLHLSKEPLSKLVYLIVKLRTQLGSFYVLQVLEHLFIFTRPNHCKAVSLFEKVPDKSSYSVLFFYSVRRPLLVSQRHLQILPLCELIAVAVY